MIDIHIHILPGFDDGAKDIQTALDMAQIAASGDIETIIATPHVMAGVSNYTAADIISAVDELNSLLCTNNITLQVLAGAEYYLESDLPQRYADGELLTLNNRQYLLVELPFAQMPIYTSQVLYELQLQGITPVIAHPERNSSFISRPQLLGELVERGNLVQITSGSLLGNYGRTVKKAARYFLTRGWVHAVASDAHSVKKRAPHLLPAARELNKMGGIDCPKILLSDNPLSIVEGRPVQSLPPIPAKKFFFRR
jgi:protein-tyrosine phosphatase